MGATRKVKVTLAVGVVLVLAASALTSTRSPARVVRVGTATDTANKSALTLVTNRAEICQGNEVLPAGVSAIRVSLGAYVGSRVRIDASSGSHVLTTGSRGPDWTGGSVTVPVTPLRHTVSHVTLCVELGPNSEPIYVLGAVTPARDMARVHNGEFQAGQPLGGRVGIEYLAAGHSSWWSGALSVARHMGIGRVLSGTWVVLLIAALMASAGMLALGLAARSWHQQPGRGVPRVVWLCALVAFLNAAAWGLIVPPFQGRDEVDHFAYIEQLAENGAIPENEQQVPRYSPEETIVLEALHYGEVVHSPQKPTISSTAQQRLLVRAVRAGASLRGSGEAGVATSEPPLYYALMTIPYEIERGNILNQLELMRLIGALFGALTTVLACLFLREALPACKWASTVAGICVALAPLVAFISATVNPDTMLLSVSAGVFLCLARAFRRGLTPRLAITLGALLATGLLTKLIFYGFAAGTLTAILILAARATKTHGWKGLTTPLLATSIAISPLILYITRNLLTSRPALGALAGSSQLIDTESLSNELSYIWQLYLPRIPGMTQYFQGLKTYKDIWFDRSIGLYGWMDTTFPTWTENLALIPTAILTILCGRQLLTQRRTLKARLPELAAYTAIIIGLLVNIGAPSYFADAIQHRYAFGEPRYLLPLLPLLAAAIALATRGAGRRWTPIAGAATITLLFAHDIFSQLQVIARYYG
jgi:Predicted membrane protein (DUF2142)